MDSKQEFIKVYEYEYEKANEKLREIAILGFCCLILFRIIFDIYRLDDRYVYGIFLLYFLGLLFFRQYMIGGYSRNIYKIIFKYKEDLDVDFARSVFEALLKNKRRLDYIGVLNGYLDLLFYTGHFNEFKEVYKKIGK